MVGTVHAVEGCIGNFVVILTGNRGKASNELFSFVERFIIVRITKINASDFACLAGI